MSEENLATENHEVPPKRRGPKPGTMKKTKGIPDVAPRSEPIHDEQVTRDDQGNAVAITASVESGEATPEQIAKAVALLEKHGLHVAKPALTLEQLQKGVKPAERTQILDPEKGWIRG